MSNFDITSDHMQFVTDRIFAWVLSEAKKLGAVKIIEYPSGQEFRNINGEVVGRIIAGEHFIPTK